MEFHVVLSGACWAAAVGGEPVRLAAGDMVMFPHGDAHVVSSAPGMRAPPNAQGYFERRTTAGLPFTLHLDAREVTPGRLRPAPGDAVLVLRLSGLRSAALQSADRRVAAAAAFAGDGGAGLDRAVHAPSRGGIDGPRGRAAMPCSNA